MTKEQAIAKIEGSPSIYLNDDQKRIARGIINSIPDGEDVLNYYDFIMSRADVGFKFDVAPEIATGRIAVVSEMQDLNINTTDKVDVDENKLIIGDNYEALKNLLLTHKEKIDVIYIDPPYNTDKSKEDGNTSSKEGGSSKFVYKDKFGRNGWLNMMRDRLTLARRLLSPSGVIFVSIDDTEQAYLKVLMDEIFGEENFIASMPRVTRKGGKTNNYVVTEYDYLLIYEKSKILKSEFGNTLTSGENYKYKDEFYEERGRYQTKPLDVSSLSYSKTMDYVICDKGNNKYYAGGIAKYNIRQQNIPMGKDWTWRWSNEKLDFALDKGFAFFRNGKVQTKIYENKIISNSKPYKIIDKKLVQKIGNLQFVDNKFSNFYSKKELDMIFTNKVFEYPKPTTFIKKLLMVKNNKNSIVLDFFAGSGTTGQAVMQLNKEDGGNRKFILVTNNENNIGLDITYERLYRVINGKTTNGNTDFDWLKKNDPFINTKLRVFNIKHFDVETNQSKELENITRFSKEQISKLGPLYNPDQLQVYYDLDGLNPLNEAQKLQEYSTDKLKHFKSKEKLDKDKHYCSCGKSFAKNEELAKHIGEKNE